MPSIRKNHIVVVVLLSVLLSSAAMAGFAVAEQKELLEQRAKLRERVGILKQEQDFLLFQKVHYELDSKYLVLDLSRKQGQLKYKNRLLKDFMLESTSPKAPRLQQGAVNVTAKIEHRRNPHALLFNNTLILQPRGSSAYRKPGVPRLTLDKRDFKSIYHALEKGSLIYVLP